ncbi:MAG: paraquat-inducible protein A [Colwelliaceae bacterium]|jgi:paraquat-inducible protein A|nr:paraquat-inducible protein A [Colwelliaceae bacterium]
MSAEKQSCSRCNYIFSQRKSNSVQYTLAWTIAAIIMFIPANIYPMMVFYTLGRPESSTILEGIASFIQQGLYPIAFIIFIASFVIPLGKIIGLLILLYNTKSHSRISKQKQTKMYYLIASLGPWSMLDVFVVSVMAAAVNFGFFTSIEAGSGITYFTLMVIFTIFAAESFDPRLLWDIERRNINER